VATWAKEPIVIKVRDAYKPYTYYLVRETNVDKERTFHVKMPISPNTALVEVYNKKYGNKKSGEDTTFQILRGKKIGLERSLNCFNSNQGLKDFVGFAQQFAERLSITSAGHTICMSDDGKFRIDLLSTIRDRKTNSIIPTPARISHKRGVIEVSKQHLLKYTVPMRVAILMHEYSHFYINKDIANETEADLNAVLICLSLGYPKSEIAKGFIEVFKGSPKNSNANKVRLKKILLFIDKFESFRFKMCA
jgi:hypothetical protein